LAYYLFKNGYKWVSYILVSLSIFYLSTGQKFISGFHLVNTSGALIFIPIFGLFLMVFDIKDLRNVKFPKELILVLIIFVVYATLYLINNKIFVSYFSEFIFLLFIFSVGIITLSTEKSRKYILIFMLVTFIFSGSVYINQKLEERSIQQEDINAISSFLKKENLGNQYFTLQPAFLLNNGYRNINDWDRELYVINNDQTNFDYRYLPFSMLDSNEVLKQVIDKKPVIIEDIRTSRFLSNNTELREYVEKNYTVYRYNNNKTGITYDILKIK
jgi:hypothetical protein